MSRKRATASEGLMTSVAQEKARRIATDRTSPSASSTDDEQPLSEAADENVDGMYLDTVDRSALDFDFEQVCSISLSKNNVYACLVCGKYYQGRGKQTHAYFHSINDAHHVFVNLKTRKVYILPDGYEVHDKSLNDIKAAISPDYTVPRVQNIDTHCEYSHDLSGKRYIPGFVGLNRIKSNDYINVVIQALAHIQPIRDTLLLLPDLEEQTALVRRLALLVRRMWHPKLLKAHVSPHEFVQEAVNRSKHRFRLDTQCDAFEFLTWLLNVLHIDLGGTRKRT
ncbi:U4 U6.U5 tri-snRNP-associated protein, partial [Coemansia sp. RSA 1933]